MVMSEASLTGHDMASAAEWSGVLALYHGVPINADISRLAFARSTQDASMVFSGSKIMTNGQITLSSRQPE